MLTGPACTLHKTGFRMNRQEWWIVLALVCWKSDNFRSLLAGGGARTCAVSPYWPSTRTASPLSKTIIIFSSHNTNKQIIHSIEIRNNQRMSVGKLKHPYLDWGTKKLKSTLKSVSTLSATFIMNTDSSCLWPWQARLEECKLQTDFLACAQR